MRQTELGRVESLPRELLRWQRQALRDTTREIHRIADERMSQRRKVNADLVRAACLEAAQQRRPTGAYMLRRDVRHRSTARVHHRHLGALGRVTPDWRLNSGRAGQRAAGNREILAPNAAILHLSHESSLRLQGFGNDQQTAGVFVESMHNAGAWYRVQRGCMREKSILQSALPVSIAGMDDQAGGLVDDQHVLIFEHDIQRDVFRQNFGVGFDWNRAQHNGLTAKDLVFCCPRIASNKDFTELDPTLQLAAGIFREQLGQRLIEPQSSALLGDHPRHLSGGQLVFAIIRAPAVAHHHGVTALKKVKRNFVVSIVMLLLGACASEPYDETRDWSVDKIYSEAKSELDAGNFTKALKLLEKLEARYPYSRYAAQAQIETAYAHWKDNEPALALADCDRFIKLHPNHPSVDYAYYLKGRINFNEDVGLLGWLADKDLTERDPKAVQDAFDAFKDLVQKFPTSKYAPDARLRMRYLANTLASHEVQVAEYYLRRGAYVAAVNRAQTVLLEAPRSPMVERALVVMISAYDVMGEEDLREAMRRTLQLNFPQNPLASNNPSSASRWKSK
jgi:outer membrane protein assembly factor BamD